MAGGELGSERGWRERSCRGLNGKRWYGVKLWLPVFIERSPAERRMLGRHGNPSKIVLFVAGRAAVEREPELPACIQVCWQPPASLGPVAQYQASFQHTAFEESMRK